MLAIEQASSSAAVRSAGKLVIVTFRVRRSLAWSRQLRRAVGKVGPDRGIQVVDARDVAAFALTAAADGRSGMFKRDSAG